jgi:uncharacterized Ntn-hydrolase superfamily protein
MIELPPFATFSLVAWDPNTGDLGIAVESRFLAVGAVVPWARAGVGAVATQAWANTRFGPDGLALLAEGLSAGDALSRLISGDEGREQRQVGMVDALGRSATYTGGGCTAWAGGRIGMGYACQGNILVSQATVDAMAETFETTRGGLWDRLVAGLAAGQAAGGDSRGQQSAALLVVREAGGYGGANDRFIDLRVDDHVAPIGELARLLALHKLYLFPTDPADLVTIDGGIARELQALLRRTGHYAGPVDGVYDDATRAAFRALAGLENLEEHWRDDPQVDRIVLEFLRNKFGQGDP